MAALPTYVKILAEGYEKDRASGLVRTQMEDGMVKQLRARTRVLLTRGVTFEFSSLANYQSFITWFQTDIDYGALWFDFTDPEDSVVKSARIVSKLDKERPIFAASKWRIGVQLETWSE